VEAGLTPGTDFAGLRIERLIGAGGMGEVYLAHDETLDRLVAVKVVAPALARDERYRERFLREARLAASLEHPAIVPVYGAGEAGGQLYLAMRFLDGGSLADRIAERGRIHPAEAVRLLAPVANALDVAHAAGLIHRDIKPGNVLLQGESAFLADFGLARSAKGARDLTRDDGVGVSGTVGYVAPEQLEGDTVSAATDQYALACVLFECVTGRRPYERENDLAVVYAHLSEPPPRATAIVPDLPRGLDAVLARAMAKDPADRYGSCGQLVTAFAEASGLGQTMPAPRTRPRRPLIIGGIVVLAAAAAGAGFLATRNGGTGQRVTAGDAVAVLDPVTLQPKARVPAGATPSSATTGGGAVWVLNTDDQTITRIDPATERVVRTFGLGATPFDLTYGAGALWVTTGSPATTPYTGGVATAVTRVDPATNSPVHKIDLPPAEAPAAAPSGRGQIAFGLGAVWVADPDGSVLRIDPATNGRTVIPNVGAYAIAVGDGAVWTLSGKGVREIDPATNRAAAPIPLQTTGATSMAVGAGAIWVADPEHGNVIRLDPGPPVQAETITTALGASVVSFASGRVWVTDSLAGTVMRIDPAVNRVVGPIGTVRGAPQTATVAAGGVWVPTLGSGQAVPAAPPQAGGIQSSQCGPVYQAAGAGRPQFLIASDFPLKGVVAESAAPMASAVRFVVQEHGFRAGRFSIGYQSCDSSADNPKAAAAVCAANAHAYAQTPQVVGIVGTRASRCAAVEIPILNVAPHGPLAMVSPANTSPALTLDPKMMPSGTRSYGRVIATDDRQIVADAMLAHRLGVQRPFIVQEQAVAGDTFIATAGSVFAAAAAANGMTVAGTATWVSGKPNYDAIVSQVRRSHADGVFFTGYLDRGVKTLVTSLRAGIGYRVPFITPDSFLPISAVVSTLGRAALGIYLSSVAPTNDHLSATGRQWARRFATTQPGGAVDQYAPLSAEAAEVLLDAIAKSDGTRASVAQELMKSRAPTGNFGPFVLTPTGDVDPAVITILRVVGGNQPGPNFSQDFQGGVVDRTIDVPA
jgi:ABC-type branched-subunit amino acid transport system substrate-binding protein